MQQALRWFIDNFSTIADWRATLLRIASFRQAAVTMDRLGANENRIEFVEAPSGEFAIEDLQIAMPTGCAMLSERHLKIAPGERVLIIGEPGSGKTILFRAIAGLWPWGTGRVTLPPLEGVMFIPHRPYVPLGTLRAALAYPSPETNYTDEQLVGALQCAGLVRLSSWLDSIARWDRELMEDEQQCLVFTRLLLHKPRWLVMDEGLDALDRGTRQRVISLFKERLKDTAIINIGRPEAKDPFFTRPLHLIKDPHGRYFLPDLSVAFVRQPKAAPAGSAG